MNPHVRAPRRQAGRPRARLERTAFVGDVERRPFLRQSLSLGALALLTGCDITDRDAVRKVLNAMSRWNDGAQAALFNPRRLAPTYPEGAVARDFRYNAYYGYHGSFDMPSARHPQAILAFDFADRTLPARYGFPMKIRVPAKLGFKNPKFVTAMFVTNRFPGGFWEDRGYNRFAGV